MTVSESLPTIDTGAARAPATTSLAVLQWATDFRAQDIPLPEGFIDVDTIVESHELDPTARASMRAARQRLADRLSPPVSPLAALRLRRGLSQKQLARAIGTSQPHVARIEGGRDNVLLATANQLAAALDVTLGEINAALGFGKKPE